MQHLKILFSFFVILFNFSLQAQNNLDTRKFIEVTGSAEMTIQPDEIELEIVLVEYDKEKKKIKLSDVESIFYDILKKNNINTESIILNSSNTYHWLRWWSYRDKSYVSKTVKLKLTKETNFLKLVEDLNEKWVQSIQIANTTNKDIQKYRKEVKVEAVKAAKEKATFLLESIGERIGSVISIEELPEGNNYWNRNRNLLSNSNISSISEGEDAVKNVASIKLRYEIKAKFEIK
jgi:uncharacterized protein YggE